MKSGILITCSFVIVIALIPESLCIAQSRSPSALISFLTYQSGRSKEFLELTNFSMSIREYKGNVDAAKSLAELGDTATPEIERVMTSLVSQGRQSRFHLNAGWVLLAYAKIKGPPAY